MKMIVCRRGPVSQGGNWRSMSHACSELVLWQAGLVMVLLIAVVVPAMAKEKYQRPRPIQITPHGEKWAERELRKLSVEEKVGQLFMVQARAAFFNAKDPDYLLLVDAIHKYHLGGFVISVPFEPPFLYKTGPYEAAVLLNRLQQESKLPLLVSADFERGLAMRFNGATGFPHAMAFGAAGKLDYAEAFGRVTAEEARAIGVHWNFFPVADVNSNADNPIINTRSFGGAAAQVSDFVTAYIKGAKSAGMLTTAKHFPGHGDTGTDSHLGVAQVGGDLQRLQTVELAPFQRAIGAGVDSVMVAHLTVPALEPDQERVATTSPAIVNGLLRGKLGFGGLVVTDALDMGGLTRLYADRIGRAAVDAFKAGNDILLMPADLDASFNAMLTAVRGGEITQAQLDASVLKILRAKASVGLDEGRLVDVKALSDTVGRPESLALAQQIADDAMTLVKDNHKLLPLAQKPGTDGPRLPYQDVTVTYSGTALIVFSDDVRTDAGRMLERQLRGRAPGTDVVYVDARTAAGVSENVLSLVGRAQTVIVAVEVVPAPGKMDRVDGKFKNSVSLPGASAALLQRILDAAAARTVVMALGSPYLAAEFPAIQNYLCAFSSAPVSETSAVKAIFGEAPIRGHLPISIPGTADQGAGLQFSRAAGRNTP